MITVNGLTKRYARHTAVDNISFSVQKGQIVGFLGPNGAGKTTTMRILTGFLPPTSGTASIAGFDVLEQPLEVKRRIGYLPENPPLYNDMTTREYVAFVGRLKGLRSAELKKRLDFVIERCAIGNIRDKQLGKISKGYRQRVGLAQAIIHNPEVLILDEPTSGLDPNQINETRTLIQSLAGDHTVMLSTHILPEVEQICERVIIINQGRLVTTDEITNLQRRPEGAEGVLVEIGGRNGSKLDPAALQQKLSGIPGIIQVKVKQTKEDRAWLEIENEKGFVRGDLARAIVAAGWDLNELQTATVSLEQAFLELTAKVPEKIVIEDEEDDQEDSQDEAEGLKEKEHHKEAAQGTSEKEVES